MVVISGPPGSAYGGWDEDQTRAAADPGRGRKDGRRSRNAVKPTRLE
jgi:hypothetical protein